MTLNISDLLCHNLKMEKKESNGLINRIILNLKSNDLYLIVTVFSFIVRS